LSLGVLLCPPKFCMRTFQPFSHGLGCILISNQILLSKFSFFFFLFSHFSFLIVYFSKFWV
ncbi:hypothetical protein MKX01_000544, partial [Papaver californicum]